MNKSLIAAGLALGLAVSSNSQAGGLQLDPTGGGGAGVFLTGLGDLFGNALAQDAFGAATNAGDMYVQNFIDISGATGIATSRLTFVMDIPIFAGPGTTFATRDFNFGPGTGTGSFSLYYEDAGTGGLVADKALGTGFTDGALLATGSVTRTAGQGLSWTNTIAGTVPLASNSAIPTIQGTGSGSFDIDITFKDDAYVRNAIDAVVLDVKAGGTLSAPFDAADGLASVSFAEAGAAAINYGVAEAPLSNDFFCGTAVSCDMQFMAVTALDFFADVPEPGTLALLGASLSLMGVTTRRRRRKIA